MRCKICAATATAAFSGTILKTYQVEYYRCQHCGFLQTEAPYWLEEAYASAISDLDLGPVNRAVGGSAIVESVIATAFNPNGRFIDWGGGYGMFTRLMRDKGYDFYWYDLYCQNLFAKQFPAVQDTGYELLTAFEVFEHLVEPIDEIAKMLKRSRNILFTTLLPPAELTAQDEWWYLAPETGQHIAIYQLKTLRFIAERFGLRLNTDGAGLHLLTEQYISDRKFNAVIRNLWISWTVRWLGRRRLRQRSFLAKDFRAVTGWNI